jgi:predicted nucleotidyltransferase
MAITDFRALLQVLAERNVEFVLVGGAAATAHGAIRLTLDVDIVYQRSRENLERLVEALQPHHPYLRGAPPGLPFLWDAETLRRGLNFTLTLDIGALDLLGEVTGGGTYEQVLPYSLELQVYGVSCRCVTLSKLIELKRAAGRPKDFEAIAELEALWEEMQEGQDL